MADKKDTKAKVEEMKEQVKNFFVPRFAKNKVEPLWETYTVNSVSVYTTEQIQTALVKGDVDRVRIMSEYLWRTSPFYRNLLYYMATIISFDYIVFPDKTFLNKGLLEENFLGSAKIISEMDVKTTFPIMLLRTLKNGSTYWYDLGTTKETMFQEINSQLCQLAFIDEDNLWRYFINLSKLTKSSASTMPEEIRDAYKVWSEKKSKKKVTRTIDGVTMEIPSNLYLVSKKGFSFFASMRKEKDAMPFFSSMFTDLNNYEDNKEFLNDDLKADAIKLVHLKIPTDKNTGAPLMDEDLARRYHESAKNHLPSNVAPLTNPFDVQGITMEQSQNSQINLVEHSKSVAQTSSGVSSTLSEASTTNGLAYSILNDATSMYPFLYYFNAIVNYKIRNQKFKVRFLQINQYNRDSWHKTYAADLANGGLRSLFVSTWGIEMYDFYMASKMEKLLDFDDMLEAKLNANQMSGDTEVGNPGKEDKDKEPSTESGDGFK